MVPHWFLLLTTVTSFVTCSAYSWPTSSNNNSLSRHKRFLLFPINAQLLFTISGGKGLLFKGPGGYNVITELDMYHPLPDYRYRISSLRLSEIAMLPNAPPFSSPPAPPSPVAFPMDMHPDGSELSSMEVQQYLKDHPETWIPPGYGQDRSDWSSVQENYNRFDYETDRQRWIDERVDYGKLETDDPFNISHHRDWEHFYHYRERRELYHSLETEIGERIDFPMKSCILRSICEVRAFLLPPGRSMIMDIVRIVFRVPLKEELQDEYSAAMRENNRDCHKLYGEKCPISIVYLLLFGKFVR
ncbi:uncharacterized protein LOC131681192 [Topomyia yanbarensis]|uniref:uncharacterized protein LOC131681192 n=1 Tax=Topomyia yanbarensis TaxID=2498891 RepID=UPI00273C1304|nr:uncharacterized protein LOC131681192 [Topomyia yanbarensis]